MIDFTTPGFEKPVSPDEQFFYDHAGYSWNPKTETPEEGRWRCARKLRAAEVEGKRRGWHVVWEPDPDAMWDDDVERETTEYDQYVATLYDEDDKLLACLGSIDLGPNNYPDLGDKTEPYVRVVEAELVLETLYTI